MRSVRSTSLVASILFVLASDAWATRSIRVAFDDWSEAQPIGSAACPGTTAGSSVIHWNGFVLVGSEDPLYLTDAYCQTTLAGEFDENSFNGEDSPVLRRLVGINADQRVTAIRYTFLDRNRFDPDKQGFQWVIYSFPGVELVGLNNSANFALTAGSYIAREDDESNPYWNAEWYPNGEYECFIRGSSSWGPFSDTTQLTDSYYQFSAEYDFGPSYRGNPCVGKLTGAFSNSFENP